MILDQADHRHFAHTEQGCRVVQDEFSPLGALALTVDRNAAFSSEVADPQLGPGVPLRGPDTEPVQERGNAGVRQQSGQLLNELLRILARLPAVLPLPALAHLKDGVIAPLPVQQEAQVTWLDPNHDLDENRPEYALPQVSGGGRMVPGTG